MHLLCSPLGRFLWVQFIPSLFSAIHSLSRLSDDSVSSVSIMLMPYWWHWDRLGHPIKCSCRKYYYSGIWCNNLIDLMCSANAITLTPDMTLRYDSFIFHRCTRTHITSNYSKHAKHFIQARWLSKLGRMNEWMNECLWECVRSNFFVHSSLRKFRYFQASHTYTHNLCIWSSCKMNGKIPTITLWIGVELFY